MTLQTQPDRQETEIGESLVALRRRWPWMVVPLLLALALTLFLTFRQEATYEATARVQVIESAAQEVVVGRLNEVGAVRSRVLTNDIALAKSDEAEALLRTRLSLGPDEDLPEGSITAEFESDVLNFRYVGATPQEAAINANTWAEVYIDLKRSEARASLAEAVGTVETRLEELRVARAAVEADLIALQDRLATETDDGARSATLLEIQREQTAITGDLSVIDAEINTTIANISRLQLNENLESGGSIRVLQAAVPPEDTTARPLSRNLVLGVLFGAIVGGGLVSLREQLDQSVAGADDVTKLGLTTLGVIPRSSRSLKRLELANAAETDTDRSAVEAYQRLRAALQFPAAEKNTKVILVTSPADGDGKTTTAVNLALAYTSAGRRVVLVDANFRSPRIHSIFDAPRTPGFSDTLAVDTTLADATIRSTKLPSSLLAIPAGTEPSNPAAFLASSPLDSLLGSLESQYDVVILDTPAALPFADVLSLCSADRGVIMVTNAGTTTRDELLTSVDAVERSGGTLLGVVLNMPTGQRISDRIDVMS